MRNNKKIKLVVNDSRGTCWLFHDWIFIRTEHNNDYYLCKSCRSRRVDVPQEHEAAIDGVWMFAYRNVKIGEGNYEG